MFKAVLRATYVIPDNLNGQGRGIEASKSIDSGRHRPRTATGERRGEREGGA